MPVMSLWSLSSSEYREATLCYPRRCSRLIRTECRHSLGLPRGDNHVKLQQ